MSKTVWHKGPPPDIGWWPASLSRDIQSIRWWDGEQWSFPVYPSNTAKDAARAAAEKCPMNAEKQIEWTERWWL